MKSKTLDLIKNGDRLFSNKQGLNSLWQETAEQFYVERADFTASRSLGSDFASHLMTGIPAMARRDLANQLASMLRSKDKDWFSLAPADEELADDPRVTEWSKAKCDVMRRAMYDTDAMFTRATKEGDNDFITFGQTVISLELDLENLSLLYKCWHLRDMAWEENDRGQIDYIHRRWKMTARNLCRKYEKTCGPKVHEIARKEPFKEFKCRHVIVPFDEYDYQTPDDRPKPRRGQFKYMSVTIDCDNEQILEEVPVVEHQYIIPRWQTCGSQYACSPATTIALPDSKLLQRITFTLLQAGEKAVDPPLVAVREFLRSDIAHYAGGVTWADGDYDESKGQGIRSLMDDKNNNLAFGEGMADRYVDQIKAAFYLNQIILPPAGPDMTAEEVRARLAQYIRQALPLFEPMEQEYNGQICEKTWGVLMRAGAFGSPNDPEQFPPALAKQEMKWVFESPLTDARRKQDAVQFRESVELVQVAAAVDPSLAQEFDARKDFRKALQGIGASVVDEQQADEMRAQAAQQAQFAQMANMAGHGGAAAEAVGKGVQALTAQPPQQKGAPQQGARVPPMTPTAPLVPNPAPPPV